MAQLDFFATMDESLEILQDIFARGDIRAYIGQGPYDWPEAPSFMALTEDIKEQLLQRTPMLYLFGSYSTSGPVFQQQTTGIHAGKYYLYQSGGGPNVSFCFARERPVGGRLTLLDGGLLTQPYYKLDEGRYEKPSVALKEAQADIWKRTKRHLKRYQQAMWIAPKAVKLFETGQAQITALGILCDLGYLPSAPALWEQVGTYPEIHDLFEQYGVASVVKAAQQAPSKAEIRRLLETGQVRLSSLQPVPPRPKARRTPGASTPPAPPVPRAAERG